MLKCLMKTQKNLKRSRKGYNHPTIPVVTFIDNKQMVIGGCDDTISHLAKDVPDGTSEAYTARVL